MEQGSQERAGMLSFNTTLLEFEPIEAWPHHTTGAMVLPGEDESSTRKVNDILSLIGEGYAGRRCH